VIIATSTESEAIPMNAGSKRPNSAAAMARRALKVRNSDRRTRHLLGQFAGRSLENVAEAEIVADLKKNGTRSQLTFEYGTLRLTVIAVPLGAEVHEPPPSHVGVTVPTEIPDPASDSSIRACTEACVEPEMTATRQPSRAAVVKSWETMPRRDDSTIPITSATKTGAMQAISTALVPLRFGPFRRIMSTYPSGRLGSPDFAAKAPAGDRGRY
jgi:hypothetical protein